MKHLKLFESFEDIPSICKKYGIENYTINSDGSIDVEGNVDLSCKKLTKLPLKFKNVSGNFHCYDNQLTSLEGCPSSVGGYFHCTNNKLTSLEGCPSSVGGDFYCYSNRITSLEGCPSSVGGGFYCHNNPIYNVWRLFQNYSKMEFFQDCDPIRDDKVIILDRLNYFLETIGKPTVKKVEGYKCI